MKIHETTMAAFRQVLHPVKAVDYPQRIVHLTCRDGALTVRRIHSPACESVAVTMTCEHWEAVVRWHWQDDRKVYVAGCVVTFPNETWQEVTP